MYTTRQYRHTHSALTITFLYNVYSISVHHTKFETPVDMDGSTSSISEWIFMWYHQLLKTWDVEHPLDLCWNQSIATDNAIPSRERGNCRRRIGGHSNAHRTVSHVHMSTASTELNVEKQTVAKLHISQISSAEANKQPN